MQKTARGCDRTPLAKADATHYFVQCSKAIALGGLAVAARFGGSPRSGRNAWGGEGLATFRLPRRLASLINFAGSSDPAFFCLSAVRSGPTRQRQADPKNGRTESQALLHCSNSWRRLPCVICTRT
jgi:hypothetical protein